VGQVLDWYFENIYRTLEGPGVLPFYCDPERVGHFAVAPDELATGKPTALFGFFVAQAMFQARRDVLIMEQQRGMRRRDATSLLSPALLRRKMSESDCAVLASSKEFDRQCSVAKTGLVADCARHHGVRCHVKDATGLLNRVGDMGKLPTSAWLHLLKEGALTRGIEEVTAMSTDPRRRAELLVDRFSRIHRVGRKLATMFVSALSTPPLAPGLTPWFPKIDGNDLVVVDTNVARAVAALRAQPAPSARGYDAAVLWIRNQARAVDLRRFDPALPKYSPRIVQQALYVFCSRSNRASRSDPCADRASECTNCIPRICPFRGSRSAEPRLTA
jgi:hypothetical protein